MRKQKTEAELEATRLKRSAAAKLGAKTRAAALKADRIARRKESRAAPMVRADLAPLLRAVRVQSEHIARIDRRVGQLHLDVATLIGHCVIKPQSVLELVQEMLIRLAPHELAKLGIFAPDQRPRPVAKENGA